ncbi:MAG: sugar ABC transporter substrate-binding protein [Blautia sp.]|nr:sugar ABC transporter substrate-binding protein [Blautia sp.]
MKKLTTILAATAMTITMAAAGASLAHAEDSVKIGMSFISTADAVIAQTLDLAREKAEENGAELLISDAQSDPSNQMTAVENFIESDCDVIVIQALDPASMSEKAKEAMDKGIKVIAYGIGLDNCDVWYKNDNTVTGTAIGEMAAKWVNDQLGGSANVCVIGFSMMDVLLERSEAIKAAMENTCTGEVNFVAEFDAIDAATGMSSMESALAAHPEINCVVSISDGSAIGAYEAAKAKGYDGDDFGVFGSDLSLVAVQYILDGTTYRGTVDVDNLVSGPKTVEIALNLVNGGEQEDVVVMGCVPVTAENAEDYAYLLEQ